jgi:putative transcriptional regulator
MATKAKKNMRLTEELLETAKSMRASGLLSKAAHEKIAKRHLGAGFTAPTVVALSGERAV